MRRSVMRVPRPGRQLSHHRRSRRRPRWLRRPSCHRSRLLRPSLAGGGDATGGLSPFRDLADQAGLLLLAPESRGRSWDAVYSDFGPDVDFIDRALARTFTRYTIDPDHLTLAGFS